MGEGDGGHAPGARTEKDEGSQSRPVERAERTPQARPVRWGAGEPANRGVTENLSAHGMFIVTSEPADPLTEIGILLHFDEQWEALRGTVVWNRPQAGEQPAGIGVQLTDTTGRYLQYIKDS